MVRNVYRFLVSNSPSLSRGYVLTLILQLAKFRVISKDPGLPVRDIAKSADQCGYKIHCAQVAPRPLSSWEVILCLCDTALARL
jgi:hypothetical protein